LEKEFLALSIRWDIHEGIFRSGKPEDAKAFEWGAHAWHYLSRGMIDSMLITIGRMMDPASTGKKENLSLARLLEMLPAGAKKDEISAKIDTVRSAYNSKIQPWRNWVLAHADLSVAKDRSTLPEIPCSELEEVIMGLLRVARDLSLLIRDTDNDFRFHLLSKQGPRGLVETMKKGVEAREREIAERRQRLEGGQ
jgi:hypothetical protein